MNISTGQDTPITPTRVWKAVAAGLITSAVTAVAMAVGMNAGIMPLPEPLGLAFAQWLLGQSLPMVVGLLFHTVYVTGWSVLFILLAPGLTRFLPILGLGLALWLIAIIVFTPLVGWGIAATGVAGPRGIIATLIPHLLFSVVLWLSYVGLNRGGNQGQSRTPIN